MAFTIKQLQASITINPQSTTPTFKGTGNNTITFGGSGANALRMKAEIHNSGGIDSSLDLIIYGLSLSVMNQLSTYGTQLNLLPKNQITLLAGDASGMSQVYLGSIITCTIDFHQPEAAMHITANASAGFAASSAKPASYSSSVDVATAMQSLASQMNLSFENNGVNVQLPISYFYGSPRDQYNTIKEHADISATISNGILAIWPKFKNRKSQIVTIMPSDGSMIDYPAYTATGVMLRALFNPLFEIGRQVTVSGSQLTPVNTTWNIYSVNHMLEAQSPNGKWESVLFGSSPNAATPVL